MQGIDINNQKLTIRFRFPKCYENDEGYRGAVIRYVKGEVSKQMDEVFDVLFRYGLRLHKDIECVCEYSLTLGCMSNNLEVYINSLSKENVVISEDVFDVFPTRDICIDSIISNRLSDLQNPVSTLIFLEVFRHGYARVKI